MLAIYEYWQSLTDGQWYFHLKAPHGSILMQSVGYQSQEELLEGIADLRRYADVAPLRLLSTDLTTYC